MDWLRFAESADIRQEKDLNLKEPERWKEEEDENCNPLRSERREMEG